MAVLGELESSVMDVLWRVDGAVSVRDVHTEIARSRDLAYTTVMTVLDRLEKKSLVSRVRQGRQWLYSPSQTREDLIAGEVLELLGDDPAARHAVWAEIIGRLPSVDRDALKELLGRPPSVT
ncbi:MAG: BlaI/MecI/CopY family transcriptional regulator [Propionibacteriaceae bacterium]|nr:BlaI/MecI/CopY family transcriptional regulator [Propionibacteriaceae bacterium]